MRVRLAAGLAAALIAGALVSVPPVSADKGSEPASSGVVDRVDTIGGHRVGPIATDVAGTMLPVVVVVGWYDALAPCTGAAPVFNGVQQDVVTPSGMAPPSFTMETSRLWCSTFRLRPAS